MYMRHLRCAVLVAVSSLLFSPIAVAGTTLKPVYEVEGLLGPVPSPYELDILVKKFRFTAFVDENYKTFPIVRKWYFQNVTVRIADNLDVRTDNLPETMRILSELTGKNFTLGDYRPPEPGQTGITISRDTALSAGCTVTSFARTVNLGNIVRAAISVSPNQNPDQAASCLAEELSQALGLPGDTAVAWHSLWLPGVTRPYKGLTYYDAVILRTLYDPRMKAGMRREEAMSLARQIIAELIGAPVALTNER